MASHRPAGPPPPNVSGRTVLLAEDDADLRGLLAIELRNDGYEVIAVADGEALQRAVARSLAIGVMPDLVITDVWMPGRTGLEVIAELRAAGVDVPVIVVTAFADSIARARARRLGAILFDKPFEPDDLRTAALLMLDGTPERP